MILIIAIFGLLVGLDRGSNVGWSNPITIAGLCTTPLFLVFVLIEKYVAKHPFAPGHIILDRSLIACYLCNFFAFGGWLAAIFFIPLYWQVTFGFSASQAGLLLVPSIICGVSGSLFSGIYMKRTAKYYWITVIAYSNLTIGLSILLLFAGTIKRSIPVMVAASCLCSFSNGIGVTTTLIGLSKFSSPPSPSSSSSSPFPSLPPHHSYLHPTVANASHADQAIATACSYLFRSLGSVFGVSMCATAFNQVLRSSLATALRGSADAEEIADRVRAGLAYYRGLEPQLQGVVRECYGEATRAAFCVSVVLVAGSAVSAWGIREKRLGG